jgi:protoheme IX farnesyltransferase
VRAHRRLARRARGVRPGEALALAVVVGATGLWLLYTQVNALTMWLTLATFLGYAVVYTLILKPATPMNIVIGGAAGAMPPVLGWTAMTGSIAAEPLALFLIIFLWTPPHFWALAMARRDDYARAGFPMLPVTHGIPFT